MNPWGPFPFPQLSIMITAAFLLVSILGSAVSLVDTALVCLYYLKGITKLRTE
jgi:hypothetical protein